MAKRIPLYARKDFARQAAKEFILKSKVKALPINPFAICEHNGFVIRSVSQTEDLIGEIDPFDVRENPDCDAKTYLTSDGRYVIVYDDSVLSQGRIIWTIAHEIGHIVLKHLIEFEQTEIHKGLTKEENDVLEAEANIFASEFLAPAEVLLKFNCIKKNMIMRLCGLSDEAATYREEYLKRYKTDDKAEYLNKEIHKQFFNFVNNKDFYVNVYYKICPVCRNYILSSREKLCRICGNSVTSHTLTKGIVYNDGPELSNRKGLLLCPECLKTQDTKSGPNCIHCGTYMINECSNPTCKKPYIGSSRYCFDCGSPTTFLQNNTITDWETAQQMHQEQNTLKHILENDKETGRILDEWQYLLSFVKEEGKFFIYNALKSSIVKIDYDTLFIHSKSEDVKAWIENDESFSAYIISLIKKKLNVSIMEILFLEVSPDGIVSFGE